MTKHFADAYGKFHFETITDNLFLYFNMYFLAFTASLLAIIAIEEMVSVYKLSSQIKNEE